MTITLTNNNHTTSLFLNSTDATYSDNYYNFTNIDISSNNEPLFVSLTNFEMPNTFYNINNDNSGIDISYDSYPNDPVKIKLDVQNYNAEQLMDALNTKIEDSSLNDINLGVSFSFQTYKFTFEADSSFTIVDCSFNHEIGLSGDNLETDKKRIESKNICRLGGISSIYVLLPDLDISNVVSNHSNTQSIVGKVNIQNNNGYYTFYNRPENHKFLCSLKQIDNIKVQLRDNNFNIIAHDKFNGSNFALTLTFSI